MLTPYRARRDELPTEAGCILGSLWYYSPNITKRRLTRASCQPSRHHKNECSFQIIRVVAKHGFIHWEHCSMCQSMRNLPDKTPYHSCVFPSAPWTRIHIDFLGPVNSKFPEVVKMKSITSSSTIHALREIFSRHGIPKSDLRQAHLTSNTYYFLNISSSNLKSLCYATHCSCRLLNR